MAPELTNKYQKVDRDMGENQGKEPSRGNKVAGRRLEEEKCWWSS